MNTAYDLSYGPFLDDDIDFLKPVELLIGHY